MDARRARTRALHAAATREPNAADLRQTASGAALPGPDGAANVVEEGELDRTAVVAGSATTAADGKTYQVDYFNLDVIISVGYRVKSHRGTQFRMWATQRLREYIIKGFTLDDDRLKRAAAATKPPANTRKKP